MITNKAQYQSLQEMDVDLIKVVLQKATDAHEKKKLIIKKFSDEFPS
jgi:hypothetical protein